MILFLGVFFPPGKSLVFVDLKTIAIMENRNDRSTFIGIIKDNVLAQEVIMPLRLDAIYG